MDWGWCQREGNILPRNKTQIMVSIMEFLDCLYGFVSFSLMTDLCKIKRNWHTAREAEPIKEHCEKVK